MKFALIAAIAVSVLMVFFAAQNAQHAQVAFMGWYFDGPLVIILLLSFGAGVLAAFLTVIPGSLSKSSKISKLNSVNAENVSKIEAFEKQRNENKLHDKESIHEQQR
jgi:uncharacterized integral membrane protein